MVDDGKILVVINFRTHRLFLLNEWRQGSIALYFEIGTVLLFFSISVGSFARLLKILDVVILFFVTTHQRYVYDLLLLLLLFKLSRFLIFEGFHLL